MRSRRPRGSGGRSWLAGRQETFDACDEHASGLPLTPFPPKQAAQKLGANRVRWHESQTRPTLNEPLAANLSE